MRVVGLAALAVCAGLWAGEAGAATWTYTGVKGDGSSVNLTDLQQGTTYYFALNTTALYGVNFQQHSRVTLIWSTGQFDGQVADVYNVNTDVPFITSPFGAHGSFHTPQDDDNGAFIHLYDRLAFNFYPPSGHNDIDPLGTPWSLKISDNPVTAPGAVPEPATWAMMIAGFGMVGASLRRLKPQTQA